MQTCNIKCLAIGAGAIGKSISGYIFPKMGCDFLYAEIDDCVISDINHRGGYDLYSTATGEDIDIYPVRGIRAAHVDSSEVLDFAKEADLLCTAIGAANMPSFAPTLIKWLGARTGNKRLVLLMFENGTGLSELLEEAIHAEFGSMPSWFSISHASIERITKKFSTENGEYNVMTEAFIPPILTKKGLEDTFIPRYPQFFELVENAEDYYFRKLYLNNIGHAVLGYLGTAKGYITTVEAVKDPEIARALAAVWKSTGEMVQRKFGFTQAEVDEYFAGRLLCYNNTALADPLSRLCRSPLRKLGREERIIGALELCHHYGIDLDPFFPLLYQAVNYAAPGEAEAETLAGILQESGIEGVLQRVCRISPSEALFAILVNGYKSVE